MLSVYASNQLAAPRPTNRLSNVTPSTDSVLQDLEGRLRHYFALKY